MKLKLILRRAGKSSELVSSASWSGPEEVYSAGDDHQVLKWNLLTGDFTVVAKLPDDIYPTDLKCIPRHNGNKLTGASDVFALCSTDGKLFLVSKIGRIEKTVEAHFGAILSVKWNHNGTDLLTSGEDGLLKVWSRSGMLRSTLSQISSPIYATSWNPSSDRILHTSGKQLVIKPLQPNAKQTLWKAHEGLILAVDWNSSNDLIISGGEDCKYKIWDSYGRQMFSSSSHDYPITSLAWSPDGDLFAVGAFNTLRLCDRVGWSHSLEKPSCGSLYSICWSNDSTHMAGGCGDGEVLFGHVINRRLDWMNFSVVVSGSRLIEVLNVSNDTKERLETRDRIIKVSIRHKYLVVATTLKCYVYSVNNWNTPAEFDLKEGNVSLIQQSEKYFLLVDGSSIYVYSYDGRPISSPKFQGMRTDTFNRNTLAISDDTIAAKDKNDEKVVYLFDTLSGKAVGDGKPYTHQSEIIEIFLDKTGSATERRLTVVDRNRNVFLIQVRTFGTTRKIAKIGKVVESLCWSDDACIMACISEEKLKVWCWPNAAYIDKNLLSKAVFEREASEFGKEPILQSFVNNQISIRRSDGSIVHASLPPYFSTLQRCVTSGKWDEAAKLCRFIDVEPLWACLAAMATFHKHLSTAEVAYAALDESEKVQFLRSIKELPTKQSQQAELALFSGQVMEAEGIYLQSGMIFRAIMLNLSLFNWERALDLALKHKTHLDTVIAYRKRYLQNFDKEETIKKFIHYSEEIKVNWESVKAKVDAEFSKEKQ